jgi:hypothetical protein
LLLPFVEKCHLALGMQKMMHATTCVGAMLMLEVNLHCLSLFLWYGLGYPKPAIQIMYARKKYTWVETYLHIYLSVYTHIP